MSRKEQVIASLLNLFEKFIETNYEGIIHALENQDVIEEKPHVDNILPTSEIIKPVIVVDTEKNRIVDILETGSSPAKEPAKIQLKGKISISSSSFDEIKDYFDLNEIEHPQVGTGRGGKVVKNDYLRILRELKGMTPLPKGKVTKIQSTNLEEGTVEVKRQQITKAPTSQKKAVKRPNSKENVQPVAVEEIASPEYDAEFDLWLDDKKRAYDPKTKTVIGMLVDRSVVPLTETNAESIHRSGGRLWNVEVGGRAVTDVTTDEEISSILSKGNENIDSTDDKFFDDIDYSEIPEPTDEFDVTEIKKKSKEDFDVVDNFENIINNFFEKQRVITEAEFRKYLEAVKHNDKLTIPDIASRSGLSEEVVASIIPQLPYLKDVYSSDMPSLHKNKVVAPAKQEKKDENVFEVVNFWA